jgi:hypothetical protein
VEIEASPEKAPPTFYMHVAGEGDPAKLAQSVRDALALTGTPFNPAPAATTPAPSLDMDTAKIDEALGFKGRTNGGVYQFGIPRSDKISQGGMAIPPAMGTAIAINFQPTGEAKAATTGDFVALVRAHWSRLPPVRRRFSQPSTRSVVWSRLRRSTTSPWS